MPDRILRSGIIWSKPVDSLSISAELFYRRLMSVVDDFGRFSADVADLRIACFPRRVDRVREADIPRWITECETAGLIALYEANGKPFLVYHKVQQPRAKHSQYPQPPAGIECWRSLIREGVKTSVLSADLTQDDVISHARRSPQLLPNASATANSISPHGPPTGGAGIEQKPAPMRRRRQVSIDLGAELARRDHEASRQS